MSTFIACSLWFYVAEKNESVIIPLWKSTLILVTLIKILKVLCESVPSDIRFPLLLTSPSLLVYDRHVRPIPRLSKIIIVNRKLNVLSQFWRFSVLFGHSISNSSNSNKYPHTHFYLGKLWNCKICTFPRPGTLDKTRKIW